MNERLAIKAFGPVRDIDLTFSKVTVLIGDQGTGKSCVAKLFSMFKWLGKTLAMHRVKPEYYEKYNRFVKLLCRYHRIDSFVRPDTSIYYSDAAYIFEYSDGHFHITPKDNNKVPVLAKVMYVPAERSVLSVAENKGNLLKELPDSCDTFYEAFNDAKAHYKRGYDLPFSGLHFEYDTLNNSSRISGPGYEEQPVKLIQASSGIQSALPLCLVSDYLSSKIVGDEADEPKLSRDERQRIDREVARIIASKEYSETVKEALLRQLSSVTRYSSFINVAEEPELNLFPLSQLGVIQSLIRANARCASNQLVITTHSPYTLAILNLLVMAGKVWADGDDAVRAEVESIVPRAVHLGNGQLKAFSLSDDPAKPYCRDIVSTQTGMIAKNDLDSISDVIGQKFNKLYRLNGRRKTDTAGD